MASEQQQGSGIDIGIPYGGAKEVHLISHYQMRDKIGTYIAQTEGSIDARKLQTMVEFAVSEIPDMDQGNRCVELLEKKKSEELARLMAERKHERETQEDIRDATISACMATLRLLQMIMDTDCGIRKRYEIGVL